MCSTYLELGRIIRSSNGLFMIVEDFDGEYLLVNLKTGRISLSSHNVNNFRDTIGGVIKQDRIK